MKQIKIIALTILIAITLSAGNMLNAVQKEMQFGDLIITFTYNYQFRYNDKGSGAKEDGGFWHPLPPEGFYALGSIGLSGYSDPNKQMASICVKAAPGKDDALRHPKDYQWIWNDKGSGADNDGSCWRPIPPDGYVALGDVMVSGYDKPSLNDVMCVKKSLTYPGRIGAEIWNDEGSGGDDDFIAYQIIVPESFVDSTTGVFAVNSFVGNGSHSMPSPYTPVINCLKLPMPVENYPSSQPPKLTSTSMPPDITGKVIDHVTWVPFTAIKDDTYSLSWKVDNSPFYRIERQMAYSLELYDYNQTSVEQTISKYVKTGVSTTETETFEQSTNISVTYESGIGFFDFVEAKLAVTLSIELGFGTSTSVTDFFEKTIVRSIITPPGKAEALWATSYMLAVRRADDSYLSGMLSFDVDSFVHDMYPE